MTKGEVAAVLGVIRMAWPHSKMSSGEETAEQIRDFWHTLLEPLDDAAVRAAVKEMIASGRQHAPLVGDVVAVVTQREMAVPEWDEAWTEVQRALRYYRPPRGTIVADESALFPAPPADYFSHPAIAAFAINAWTELRRAPAPGTKDAGTHHAQQREAYRALSMRVQRDASLMVVGAQRPARGQLERFDPMKGLPPVAGGGSDHVAD